MSKIVYLLGAGASANALPLALDWKEVKGQEEVIWLSLAKDMKNTGEELFRALGSKKAADTERNRQSLRYLIIAGREAQKFRSVDTYAKYLYLTNHGKLRELKKALLIYFTYKQYGEKAVEEVRVKDFLVSIMSKQDRFPEDITVLTWNYDFQIEIVLKKLFVVISTMIGPLCSEIIHLNGIANYLRDSKSDTSFLSCTHSNLTDIINVSEAENYVPLIRFAWEKDSIMQSDAYVNINNRLESAESLVVIGYSFPFFNREFDNKLIESFKRPNMPKTVYIQDKIDQTDQFKVRFGIGNGNIKVRWVEDVSHYYIPLEY